MTRVASKTSLVLVVLASTFVGLLVGSGVAWAQSQELEKELGWHTYELVHEGCYIYACEYTESHTAWASDDWEEFRISNITYLDRSGDENVRFGIVQVWDEYYEAFYDTDTFWCQQIDNPNRGVGINWYHGGHDPDTYGTAITQNVMYDDVPCWDPAYAGGAKEMTLHVEN